MLLLQLGNELIVSEMKKKMGVPEFVSEIRYLKGHLNLEKLNRFNLFTPYGPNVCQSKNTANESLEWNFLCQILHEWDYKEN